MKPPIGEDGTIPIDDAASFVAEIIYPSERYRKKSKSDVLRG